MGIMALQSETASRPFAIRIIPTSMLLQRTAATGKLEGLEFCSVHARGGIRKPSELDRTLACR
jgi:hypothetical protein